MDSQTLFDLISQSPDPAAAIDRLAGHLNTKFVEGMNATCQQLVGEGRLDDALVLNDWALLALKHVPNPLLKAHTLFNRGQYFELQKNWEEAEGAHRRAMPLYEKEGSPTDILDCASLLMSSLDKQGKKAETDAVAERALERSGLFRSGDAPDDSLRALRKIGHVLRNHYESRLSRVCFSILLKMSQRVSDIEVEAEAFGVLAEIYTEEKDVEKAVEYLQRALELDREAGNWRGEIFDLGNLGSLLYRKGELEESASLFASCLGLRDEHDFVEQIELDLKNFYHVSHYLGRRGEALALFKRYSRLTSLVGEISEIFTPVTYLIYMDERGNKLEGGSRFDFEV